MQTIFGNSKGGAVLYRSGERHPISPTMTTTILTGIAGAIIGLSTVALNEVAAKAAVEGIIKEWSEWQWATFPLIGAALAAVSSIAYRNERVRETLGNFITAMIVGVMGPKLVTLIHPMLKHYSTDSILLIGFGYLWGAVGFALSKALFAWLGKRGPQVAIDEAEGWVGRREKQREKADEQDRT